MNYALFAYLIVVLNACGNIKTMNPQERAIVLNDNSQEVKLTFDNNLMSAGELIEVPMVEVMNPQNQNLSFTIFAEIGGGRKEIGRFALFPNTQPFNYIIDPKLLKLDSLGLQNIVIKSDEMLLENTTIRFLTPRKLKQEK